MLCRACVLSMAVCVVSVGGRSAFGVRLAHVAPCPAWRHLLRQGRLVVARCLGSAVDWSTQFAAFGAVAYPTRLETRTKESNMRASLRVVNLKAK